MATPDKSLGVSYLPAIVLETEYCIRYIGVMEMILDKDTGKKNIAENLRRLMDARGLTQTQLADAAGITQPFIHQLLHAKSNPNAIDLKNIAEALGVSSDFLMEPPVRKNIKITA